MTYIKIKIYLYFAACVWQLKSFVCIINNDDSLLFQLYVFSGGEQRRLSFGVALLHDPKIMILDEPTVGIDPVIRQRWAIAAFIIVYSVLCCYCVFLTV